MLLLAVLLTWLSGAMTACERSAPPAGGSTVGATTSTAPPPTLADAPTSAQAKDDRPVVLFLGDSLAAGFGLAPEHSFPSLIQERLREEGYPHRVVNAGVSGDTSAGGLARLDWLLRQRVDVMVLELGANDGLRGQDPEATRANLAAILERSLARNIRVVLAGMEMPPNYGRDYTRRFRRIYPELAEKYKVTLIPFILKNVAMRPELNLPDRIHPNENGARIVAQNVWEVLEPLLKE